MLDHEASKILSNLDGKLDDVLDRVGKTQTEVKLLQQSTGQMAETVERIEETVFRGNGQESMTATRARHAGQLKAHEKWLDKLTGRVDKLGRGQSLPPPSRRRRTIVISGSAVAVLIPVIAWTIMQFSDNHGPPPPLPPIPTEPAH